MNNTSWVNFHHKVKSRYIKVAKNLWWGDDLDVRFFLLKKLTSIKNKKILDIGCNVGITLSFLDSTNELYGLDVDDRFLNKAKKLVKIAKINKASMEKLPYEDKSFEVIIMMNVMPYYDFNISKDIKEIFIKNTFKEVYRVLKNDGVLYFTTPNGNSSHYIESNKAKIEDIVDALTSFNLEIYGWNNLKPIFNKLPKKYKYLPPKFLCRYEFVWNKLVKNLDSDVKNSKYFFLKATKKL